MLHDFPSIQKAIEEYKAEISLTKSQNTSRAYQNGVNKFLNYLVAQEIPLARSVKDIKLEMFISFISECNRGDYSKATLGLYIAGITSFKNWLSTKEYSSFDRSDEEQYKEVIKAAYRSHQESRRYYKNVDFSIKLLNAAEQANINFIEKERNVAIICFLLSTGSRPNEICKLRVSDIDFVNQTANIPEGTTRKRVVHFDSKTTYAIQYYWKCRVWQDMSDPAFARHDKGAGKRHKFLSTRSIQNVIENLRQEAGLEEDITPDKLRIISYIQALDYMIDTTIIEQTINQHSFITGNHYFRHQNL